MVVRGCNEGGVEGGECGECECGDAQIVVAFCVVQVCRSSKRGAGGGLK